MAISRRSTFAVVGLSGSVEETALYLQRLRPLKKEKWSMDQTSFLGPGRREPTWRAGGTYELPVVVELGTISTLTLGASGSGYDWGPRGMVPGDDYIPNPK